MGYLNGVYVHGIWSFKNLIVRFFSCFTAVASGLPVGPEGPMISMGALIGHGFATLGITVDPTETETEIQVNPIKKFLNEKFPFLKLFANMRDRRDFVRYVCCRNKKKNKKKYKTQSKFRSHCSHCLSLRNCFAVLFLLFLFLFFCVCIIINSQCWCSSRCSFCIWCTSWWFIICHGRSIKFLESTFIMASIFCINDINIYNRFIYISIWWF